MATIFKIDYTKAELDTILNKIPTDVSTIVDQNFDMDQKAQARANIGAMAEKPVVLYTQQDLTSKQQEQVTENIGAATKEDLDNSQSRATALGVQVEQAIGVNQQTVTQTQQQNARTILGLDIDEKTDAMIVPVGLDTNGKLWTYDIFSPYTPTSWADVKQILHDGLAPAYWHAGDQLTVKKTVDGVTEDLLFDILDFDYDTPISSSISHTMTLGLHKIYTYNDIPFDIAQAAFKLPNGLPAGNYYYIYNNNYRYFTLTEMWPANTQVINPNGTLCPYTSGTFTINGVMAATSTTPSTGITYTYLGTFLANSVSTTTVTVSGVTYTIGINAMNRIQYGSSEWASSNIRKYLNSNAAGSEIAIIPNWWYNVSGFERPIKSKSGGFKYGIEQAFLNLVVEVKKATCQMSSTTLIKSNETIFIPSQAEVNFVASDEPYETSYGTDRTFNEILEKPYRYYKNATNLDRIKYYNGQAKMWYTRTHHPSYTAYERAVSLDGSLYNDYPKNEYGIVPIICIGG